MNLRHILNVLLVFQCFAMTILCHGQALHSASTYANVRSLAAGGMFRPFDNRHKEIKGKVTLFDSYVPGIIYLDGQIVSCDKLNYDAYEGELLVIYHDIESIAGINMVRGFTAAVDGDSISFSRLLNTDGKFWFYQKLIQTERVGLYKKISKTLQEGEKSPYGVARDAQFVVTEKFLLLEKDKPLREFKNKRSFLQNFPAQESDLERFIKQEKTDFKNEADLQRLVYHLNQLMRG